MAIRKLKGNIEPFLVNPRGRKVRRRSNKRKVWSFQKTRNQNAIVKHRSTKKKRKRVIKRRRKNVGETLMIIGNPKTKGGVKSMAKRGRKRSRKNPRRRVVHRVSNVRRYRSRNALVKRHRSHRRRHNPVIAGIDLGQVMTGAISAVAVTGLPTVFKAQTPVMKYGIQLVTAVGGKFLLEKMLKSAYGSTWLIVGLSLMAADVFKEYVLQKVMLITQSGVTVSIPQGTAAKVEGAATPAVAGGEGVAGYLNELSGMGAYLDQLPADYQFGQQFYM